MRATTSKILTKFGRSSEYIQMCFHIHIHRPTDC